MADNSKFEHDTVADTGVSALVCGPGEVPIKVDDLDLDEWAEDDEREWPDSFDRRAIRAAKAKAAHLDQPATEQTEPPAETRDEWKVGNRARDNVGDMWQLREDGWCVFPDGVRGARCDGDSHMFHGWTTERLTKSCGPLTRVTDDEQPTATPETEPEPQPEPETASVSLPCPDCGETITRQVRAVRVENARTPKWYFEFLPMPGPIGARAHTCKPVQPDEPTSFGAVVQIALHNGDTDTAVRADDEFPCWYRAGGYWYNWDDLRSAGNITILSEGVSK